MSKRRQIMFLFIFSLVFANTFTAFGRVVDEIGKPSNLSDIEKYFPLTPESREKLFELGFVVLADVKTDNLASGYYSLEMKDQICVFLTTDAILSVLYRLQENLLKSTEKDYLYDSLEQLCVDMQSECMELLESGVVKEPLVKAALKENVIFFTVACRLLEKTTAVPKGLKRRVEKIVKKINKCKTTEYYPGEDYTQYKVRGYYKGDPELERYFRCMKWLSRKIFHVVNPQKNKRLDRELVQAVIIAKILKDNPQMEKERLRIYEVITMFINPPDSITLPMAQKATNSVFGNKFDLNILAKPENLIRLRKEFENLEYPESKVVPLLTWPKDLPMLKKYIQFMGERYVPDSEVFCETSEPYVEGRYLPKGLDVMTTILSSERAEEHLNSEIKKYRNLEEKLVKMNAKFSRYSEDDWHKSIYNNWLYCLKPLLKKFDSRYPLFMQTKTWQDEKLNTALSSWAQLRHLYVLYAKPSYTCTGIVKGGGYVEPIPEFYEEVAGLLQRMQTSLSEREMFPGKYRNLFKDAINGLNKFVRYARKELDGKPLSDYEKDDIHHFGSWLKGFDLKNPLMIVDICTDSYNQQVLHAGTGSYNPIIVIFKDDQDNSRAAVGYVMSYYEFVEKGINRLDDSQWKKKLEEGVEHLRPEWTKSFLFSSKVKKPAEENFDNSRKSRTDLDLMSIEDRKKLIEKIKKEQQEARWKRHKKEIRENRKRLKQEKMKGITDPEKIAEIMLELSIEYSWSNDFNAAMQGYKEVISISPQGKAAKKALLKIAALLKCAYYNKKALKRFSMNASKQSPDLTQIQDIYTMVCYADIEVNEKDIVEAYMDVVKKYPRDNCAMEALKRLGDFYYKQTELEKALSYYKRLTRDFLTRYSVEKIIEIYSKLIIDHYWQKKYEEALKLHEEFISFIPYLALCSGSLELDIEAAGKVQIIKAGGGFDWQPLNLFTDAENRISLEDYQGAISVLEDIIESYPDWKLINNVHALRVLCCSITGKIKGSSQLELESMVKEKLLEDVRRKVFWRLGNVYRDRKDFIVAASAYQRALEVNDITWWDKKDILGLMAELRWETQGEVNLPPLMYDIKLSPEEISWSTDTDVPVRAEIHYGFDKNNLKNVFQWKGKIQTCHRESHYKVKISYQDPGNRKTTVIKGEKPFYLEPNKEYYLQIICESEEGVRGKSLKYSLFTDIEKPSVTLISPRRNAVLDGEVELEAEISDNTGIAEVVFGICKNQYSRELAYLTNPPFRTKVTLENIENGNYDLNVWAKDLYGNRANRGIDIRIMNSRGDITPPKVKIIFPQSGAELSGKVKMIAEAVDDHKMGYVKFFINGQDEGCVFRPPYEREWNTTFYYPTGYQIQAKAWDESDNVGESEIIRVTVKETPEHIARQKKYPQKNKLIEHMRKEMPRVRDGIHFVDLPDSIKIGVPTKISWKITRGSNIECTDLRWDYLSHLRNSVAIEYVNGYHYRGKKFSGKSGETFTDEILLVDEMLFYDTTKGSPIMLVIHATIDGQEVCSRLVNLYVIPESQK